MSRQESQEDADKLSYDLDKPIPGLYRLTESDGPSGFDDIGQLEGLM